MTYPLETRGETGTTSPTQARCLDFADNPFVALQENFFSLVPIAHLLSALEVNGESSIEILEDPVLVLQSSVCSCGAAILNGCQASRNASRETRALLKRCSGRQHGDVAMRWQGGARWQS